MDRFVYKQKRKNVILLHVQRARRNHQKEHTHNTLEDLDRTWAGIRKKKRNTRSKIFALSAETPWQVENEQVASMRRAWNAVIKLISDISTRGMAALPPSQKLYERDKSIAYTSLANPQQKQSSPQVQPPRHELPENAGPAQAAPVQVRKHMAGKSTSNLWKWKTRMSSGVPRRPGGSRVVLGEASRV